MPLPIKETGNGVILAVRVKAGSGSFSIERENVASPPSNSISDNFIIIIRTKGPAECNKANLEIIKELSKLFRKEVRIIRGLKSRDKTIFVAGISAKELESHLRF